MQTTYSMYLWINWNNNHISTGTIKGSVIDGITHLETSKAGSAKEGIKVRPIIISFSIVLVIFILAVVAMYNTKICTLSAFNQLRFFKKKKVTPNKNA